MKWLTDANNASLAQKLRALVMGVVVSLLLLTAMTFSLYSAFDAYQESERYAQTVARVVANNATAAMSFNDSEGAREVLSALRSEPDVRGALLIDLQGTAVAGYGNHQHITAPQMIGAGAQVAGDWQQVLIVEPVMEDDSRLGYAVVEYGLTKLHEQVVRQLLTMVGLIVGVITPLVAILSVNLWFR